ncbi:MAG: hypothetical protein HQK51_08140 [Oligoflexia bacterium]|nr:hypothetical protein [Oligoflexia bacterium]
MNICDECEIKGYSEELCEMHLNHMAALIKKNPEKAKEKAKEKEELEGGKVVKAALYGGTCVLGATLAVASAPVLGFGLIAHAVAVKVSAGVLGGAVATLKSLKNN